MKRKKSFLWIVFAILAMVVAKRMKSAKYAS